MKRQEKQPPKAETRKHKAIRRTLIFLAVMMVTSTLHLYGFFPTSSLRLAEENYNCGRTDIIRRIYRPTKAEWNKVTYLSANEHAVILNRSRFSPVYGWLASESAAIDCSKSQEAAYGYAWMYGNKEEGEETPKTFLVRSFGRVDDPAVETIRMSLRSIVGYDEAAQQNIYKEEHVQQSVRSEWMEQDGHTYFLMESKRAEWTAESGFYPFLVALDAEGKVICEYDVNDWAWGQL